MDVGFIGLGIMGRPMSKNLLMAGYTVRCYSRTKAHVDDVVTAGGKGASSIAEVVQTCRFCITMLPNSPMIGGAQDDFDAARYA